MANATKAKSRAALPGDRFLSDTLQYFETHTHFIGQDPGPCRKIFSSLHEEIIGNNARKNLMIDAVYQQYILSIVRCMTEMNAGATVSAPPLSNMNMAVMITKYMHKNYNKNITVQDVADEFFISSRHVNRVFEGFLVKALKRRLISTA